jgi:hypothetical protein
MNAGKIGRVGYDRCIDKIEKASRSFEFDQGLFGHDGNAQPPQILKIAQ